MSKVFSCPFNQQIHFFQTHLWKKHRDDPPSAVKRKFLLSLPALKFSDAHSTDNLLEPTTAADSGRLEPDRAGSVDNDILDNDDGSSEHDLAESSDELTLDDDDVNVIW
jgi:hypothetical protein